MSVRAAVIEAPGRFAVESFPDPDPGPGAVVLRMHYSGICGTDKHTWRGESIQYAGTDHERDAAYPLICGHENVGVIEAIGPGDPPVDELGTPLAPGDRVVPAPNLTCGRCRFCLDGVSPYYLCTSLHDYGNSLTCAEPPHLFGGWSERMYLLPGTRLFRVPDELPSADRRADRGDGGDPRPRHGPRLRRHRACPGCRAARAHAPGQGRDARRRPADRRRRPAGAARARARRSAPTLALDASATTAEERRGEVREATGGLGADVVVDCSGRAETFPEALGLVRPGGTVVEAGAFVDLGPVPVNPNRDVCSPGVAIVGIGGETLPQYAPALRMLARHAGRLPFARAITHSVALEDVGEALETAQTGAAMKMLVAPNGAI